MKKMTNTIRKFGITVLLGLALMGIAPSAWSAIEFVKSNDSASQVEQVKEFSQVANPTRSYAPEPTTMALFGGGFLTMMISFVRRTYFLAKRSIDIVGSLIALVAFSPVILITMLLVKLTSKGPVFYSQIRVGKDGQEFEIYKFRTMRVDAEKLTGAVWATKNDSRITPIGKFLRRSRIDEIPQFINVLKGDMAIIGPRPERPIFVEKFIMQMPDYVKRLDVKPGITGLSQVFHHYDETIADVRKKIKYDILYIKNVCLWTDLRILARTVRVVLTGAGAK